MRARETAVTRRAQNALLNMFAYLTRSARLRHQVRSLHHLVCRCAEMLSLPAVVLARLGGRVVLYAEARAELVDLLRRSEIRDERVLAAIGRISRERFLPPDLAHRAYENTSLPIGMGQTISQPIVVASMTEVLQLRGSERVLEIGTGSGYQAAVLAELAAEVVTVERVSELRERATALLSILGYRNIEVHAAGDQLGWPPGAPYDRIIVTAGGPRVPAVLLDQLGMGGRLVMPVGTLAEQRIILAVRNECGIVEEDLGRVRFVPLIGAGGWPEGSVPDDPSLDGAPG